jgi:hypothetical protein
MGHLSSNVHSTATRPRNRSLSTQPLRVNEQFHLEGTSVLYGENGVLVDHGELGRFVSTIGKRNANYVAEI